MKVKLFEFERLDVVLGDLENNINEFIKDKNVIDISFHCIGQIHKILVLYEDKED